LISGSTSVLHNDTGLNLTFAAGGVTDDSDAAEGQDDYFTWGVRAGWIANLVPLGETAFAGDIMFCENFFDADAGDGAFDVDQINGTEGTESRTFGFQAVQFIDKLSMEAYVRYRNYDVDIPGLDTDSLNVVGVGARVKF